MHPTHHPQPRPRYCCHEVATYGAMQCTKTMTTGSVTHVFQSSDNRLHVKNGQATYPDSHLGESTQRCTTRTRIAAAHDEEMYRMNHYSHAPSPWGRRSPNDGGATFSCKPFFASWLFSGMRWPSSYHYQPRHLVGQPFMHALDVVQL